MRDASMAQSHDLIPLCGDKALRDAQTQCLHKAGLQRGDGHVAEGNDDGAHDNQDAMAPGGVAASMESLCCDTAQLIHLAGAVDRRSARSVRQR